MLLKNFLNQTKNKQLNTSNHILLRTSKDMQIKNKENNDQLELTSLESSNFF